MNTFSQTITEKPSGIVVESLEVNLSSSEAFDYFTINSKLEQWLTAKANVNPTIGGTYELFWEPDDPENNSTIGCKILALDAPHYLNFEWKGPKQYKAFMNQADPLTNVTVTFSPIADGTKITLIHTGWRNSADWEGARMYFANAWSGAFKQLATQLP
ncbi:MAG: SRPBCC domain-containing protein [Bacteroidota bacterium]